MKKMLLGVCLFSAVLFPSLSHAQSLVPFGGFDAFLYPLCDCDPTIPTITCAAPLPVPTLYIFHLFAPLYIGSNFPIAGWLAQLIDEPALAYPNYALTPGSWAIGQMVPLPPNPVTTCGLYINTVEDCPEGVIAGLCIPLFPAIGAISPLTGTGSSMI